MKKFLLAIFVSIMAVNLHAAYVIPANVDTAGALKMHFFTKGYILDQGSDLESYWQKDIAFMSGIQWVPVANFEWGLNPPILRYHYGKGPSYAMGLGDMDIALKYELIKNLAVYTSIRIPTGSQDLPVWDDWAPKFSTGKVGCDIRVLYSLNFSDIIGLHLNMGWLNNIGSEGDIPANRFPMAIGLTLPLGFFIEGVTDLNPYGDIKVGNTPKRAVMGIEYEVCRVKYLAAFEYGTWGTGEPPIHNWHYGWVERVTPWDITLGATIPLGSKVVPFGVEPDKSGIGIVEGKLIDKSTAAPVKGMITIKKLGVNAITNENGEYKILLPAGKYTIVLSISNYEPQTQEIEVVGNKTKQFDFLLTPVAE